jgi:hypothetical protein
MQFPLLCHAALQAQTAVEVRFFCKKNFSSTRACKFQNIHVSLLVFYLRKSFKAALHGANFYRRSHRVG